jgi:hypothetical protein
VAFRQPIEGNPMKETRIAQQPGTDAAEQEQAKRAPEARSEIRLLDDFELVLAGGGDGVPSWP